MNKSFQKKRLTTMYSKRKKDLKFKLQVLFCIFYYSLLNSKMWKMSVFPIFTVVFPPFISVSK